jgi:S-(hydroxymethyl)glutathione dehydrogenase/alcohol dehydrogenase
MKAAVLTELHRPLSIVDVTAPEALRFGQVRVRVHYSGICGSQIGEIDGVKGPDRWLPHLLGHEGYGTVLEVGEGVTSAAPGDGVVLHWMRGDGIEAPAPSYDWDGRQVNAGWVTTFNEEAVVSENRVTRCPESLPPRLAPLLGCAVTTGIGVVVNDAALRVGESIVVLGVGGVGLSEVQGAAQAGGNPIVAIDLHQPKLDLARRLGATHVMDGTRDDFEEHLAEILPEGVADVVIENTGDPRMIERAYRLTGSQGRTILVGVPPAGALASLYTLPLHLGKRLQGSRGGGALPQHDIPRYAALHEAGRLELQELVTAEYTLDEINDAIDDLRAGRIAGRALIAVSP